MSTTTNLDTLKINYLTQAQYDTALENDQINDNELYFTPSSGSDGTSTPTANATAAFDAAAHMNSTDMTAQEVEDFIDNLKMQDIDLTNYFHFIGRASGDFNDLTTSGIYYTQNGMTENKPTTSGLYGYILVIFFDDAMGIQIVIDSYGLTYSRAYAGNPRTWTTWKAH